MFGIDTAKSYAMKVVNTLGFVHKSQYKSIAVMPYGLDIGGMNNKTGLSKPSRITFDSLRAISKVDAIIRICINVIKKEVSQANWNISPEKTYTGKVDEGQIEYTRQLFKNCNSNGEHLRVLLDRLLEDLLPLDASGIELVRDGKGEIIELNCIDGATIKPCFNRWGEFGDIAYKQVINEKVYAEFSKQDLVYMMMNPQNDIKFYGYGFSNIESILLAVQASLEADIYNAKTFNQDNIPPGLLNLGKRSKEEAMQFIALWNATVIGNTDQLKFVWGTEDLNYVPFQRSNKDMQFIEYTDWLARIKLANFGLTALDANITADINKSTAAANRDISKSRGVQSYKKLIEEYFTRNIIQQGLGFTNLEFQFESAVDLSDKKTQAEIDKLEVENGALYPEEIRDREGRKKVEEIDWDIDNDYQVENPLENAEKRIRKNNKYFKPLYA